MFKQEICGRFETESDFQNSKCRSKKSDVFAKYNFSWG